MHKEGSGSEKALVPEDVETQKIHNNDKPHNHKASLLVVHFIWDCHDHLTFCNPMFSYITFFKSPKYVCIKCGFWKDVPKAVRAKRSLAKRAKGREIVLKQTQNLEGWGVHFTRLTENVRPKPGLVWLEDIHIYSILSVSRSFCFNLKV